MVKDKRLATIKYYEDRKIALAAEEAYIHAAMEPSREEIVKRKAFLLFNEMCCDAEIGNEGLLDLQVLGTPLVGVSGSSPSLHKLVHNQASRLTN